MKDVQDIDAARNDDALLRLPTVCSLTGLSASSIWRLVRAGELPVIRRGARCTRWRAGAVSGWLRRQAAPQGT